MTSEASDREQNMALLPRQSGGKSQREPKLLLLAAPTGTPRRPTLSTMVDVKREMGKIYRLCRAQRIALEDGSRLTFMLASIGKVIEIADLERRVEQLENGEP